MCITSRHAILVSNKNTAAQVMHILLKEAGVSSFTLTRSLRETLQKGSQELPHLFVVQGDLADASAMEVVEAIRKQSPLERALIFVIRDCTQEEILQFAKYRVSAVVPRLVAPQVFIDKVRSKTNELGSFSPYAIRGESVPGGKRVAIHSEARIVGKQNDHLVCYSDVSGFRGTSVSIASEEEKDGVVSAVFSLSESRKPDRGQQNFFSLASVTGNNRQRLMDSVPTLNTALFDAETKQSLLIYEACPKRAATFQRILQFHGVDSEVCISVRDLADTCRSNFLQYGAVYLCEPLTGAKALPWEMLKMELGPELTPIEITATAVPRASSDPSVVWLPRPFSIDQLLELFRVAVAKRQARKNEATRDTKHVQAEFVFRGKIVALDESGGVLESMFVPELGATLSIKHPIVEKIPALSSVRVESFESVNGKPDVTLIRFQIVDEGFAKDHFYSTLRSCFESTIQSKGSNTVTVPPGAPQSDTAAVRIPRWPSEPSKSMPRFEVASGDE